VATTFRTIAEAGYTMVSLFDWSVHKTPEEVFEYYINNATFVQSDMWLALDTNVNVNVTLISKGGLAESAQQGRKGSAA
jgi:hypothetical protein